MQLLCSNRPLAVTAYDWYFTLVFYSSIKIGLNYYIKVYKTHITIHSN